MKNSASTNLSAGPACLPFFFALIAVFAEEIVTARPSPATLQPPGEGVVSEIDWLSKVALLTTAAGGGVIVRLTVAVVEPKVLLAVYVNESGPL